MYGGGHVQVTIPERRRSQQGMGATIDPGELPAPEFWRHVLPHVVSVQEGFGVLLQFADLEACATDSHRYGIGPRESGEQKTEQPAADHR